VSEAMTTRCPECGATWKVDADCETRFHHFLALEFGDPAYGAVHNLTVPAYMFQHPSEVSREGWKTMRELLWQFVHGGASPAEVRASRRDEMDSGNRKWSIRKGPRIELPANFSWTRTILDVPDGSAEVYCEGIVAWARQVLKDTEGIG
jgi:hypothetical protein